MNILSYLWLAQVRPMCFYIHQYVEFNKFIHNKITFISKLSEGTDGPITFTYPVSNSQF